MKIVVTGGAGFIGSHLCKSLIERGYEVISLDNYFTGSKNNHVPGVDYREGHTKDIEKHISESVDLVFHLGEYSRVEKSFSEPDLVWDLNIAGSFGVLEFWRKKKFKLVYAGSSTKFADGDTGRHQSPYAWTKAMNSELVCNYSKWFDLDFAVTYFYNVFGPGERSGDYGTVVEIFKQQYLSGQPLTVVSPGTQTRIFTHVEDIIQGLLLVGEAGHGDGFGLGAEKSYSILEIAQMFEGAEVKMLPERPGNRENSSLRSESSKALGWRPVHDLREYIESVVAHQSVA